MNWHLGQVIYATDIKSMKTVPMRVVEVLRRQTLRGDAFTYTVQTGQDERDVVQIDSLKSYLFFGSAEEAEKEMIGRLTAFVRRTVDQARKNAQEWYGGPQAPLAAAEDKPTSPETPGEFLPVMLPDGTQAMARIRESPIVQ